MYRGELGVNPVELDARDVEGVFPWFVHYPFVSIRVKKKDGFTECGTEFTEAIAKWLEPSLGIGFSLSLADRVGLAADNSGIHSLPVCAELRLDPVVVFTKTTGPFFPVMNSAADQVDADNEGFFPGEGEIFRSDLLAGGLPFLREIILQAAEVLHPVCPANIGIRAVVPLVVPGNDVGGDFVAVGKKFPDKRVIGLGEFALTRHSPRVDVTEVDEECGGFGFIFVADVMPDGGCILTGIRTAAHCGEYQRLGFLISHAAAGQRGKANCEGAEHRLRGAIVWR